MGTRVSFLALPLLALETLHASALEVAFLRTAQTVAYLLIGLQAGVWCDRLRCRPVLIWADLGRAVALGSIPVAAVFHVLTFSQLVVAVFVTGLLTVFFEVGHQTYLPRLVDRADLLEGNARLAANVSVGAVAAPTLAGWLVQWFTAPAAILLDAVSYLWSALWLGSVRHREEQPSRDTVRPRMRTEIGEGLRLVTRDPLLRAIAGNNATFCLFQATYGAVIVVFLADDIRLSAWMIGTLNTVGLVGTLLASALTRRLSRVLGDARLLLSAMSLSAAAFLLFPLTGRGWGLAFFVAATFLSGFGIIAVNIVQVSFQQAACPVELRGRLNATLKFVIWGSIPVGSALGGALASAFGLRATLWIAAFGVLLSTAWLVFSPLRKGRDLASYGLTTQYGVSKNGSVTSEHAP